MERETMRFLFTAIVFVFALFGAAFLLTGCESAGRIAAYCLENSRNCD